MAVIATNRFGDPRGTSVSTTWWGSTGGASVALSNVTDMPGAMNTATRMTRTAAGSVRLIDMKIGTVWGVNASYRITFTVRASEAMSIDLYSRPAVASSANQAAYALGYSIPAGISTHSFTGTNASAGTPSASSGWTIPTTAGTVGSTLDFQAINIQLLSDADLGYFDGFTPANSNIVYAWTGAANNSTSTASWLDGLWDYNGRKMWFGSEQHMLAAPAPGTGMEVSRSGYNESLTYNNGRTGLYRTHQQAKTYQMNFPVQEAHLLDGLDVYSKFASGFYGDCNRFPLFFADPMNYDSNLFPEAWANPGLYQSGWTSIVADFPNTYENLALNPSAEISTYLWTVPAGTTATLSNPIAPSAPYGARGLRALKTGGTGMNLLYGRDGGGALLSAASGGITYTADVGFRTSISTTITLTISCYNTGGTLLGSSTSSTVNTTANVWTSASHFFLAPANTSWITVQINGTTAAHWTNGTTLDADGLIIQNRIFARPAGYFDGDTAGASWIGTRGLSVSRMYVDSQPGVVAGSAASGTTGLPQLQVTWPIQTSANAFPTPDNTYGNIPYALIPIPPGYTLWVGVTGSATGSAAVRIDMMNTYPGGGLVIGTQYATLSNTFWASPTSVTGNSNPSFAKIYVTKTADGASSITLSSMVAQLWPTGVTPAKPAVFEAGRGHRGLVFTDDANTENYVIVDRNRSKPVHYKGLSTSLVEAEENG